MRRATALWFAAAAVGICALTLARGGIGAHAAPSPASPVTAVPQLAEISSGGARVVDMTYTINGHLPSWPGDDKTFETQVVATYAKDGYFARSFWTLEHYSTHMDAPLHFAPGKASIAEIPVTHFFGPAEVIDVRDEAAKNPDYRLTAARVEKWEAAHGRIPAGAIVLLRTGWASRWPDQKRYRNQDAQGVMHFPGFGADSAKLLVARGAVGLGIDTLSIDYGASKNFEVHHVDLPAGLYNLENLANLDQLPATGAFLIAAPIKMEGGSGGPCRVFAVLPEPK
ncbi:MAG TPA: cyclase family protein [Candidatus Acidoferrales bacterium]|nr:cyclase family protein [Candidatus Acidoferrales bacterium]